MQISLGAYLIFRGYKLCLYSYTNFSKQTCQSYIQFQWRIQGTPPPPLLLDQNEARRAKIYLLGDRAPPFSKGLDERRPTPAPLSQGLDPALDFCILSLQALFNSWHSTDQTLYICGSFLLDPMRFTTNV